MHKGSSSSGTVREDTYEFNISRLIELCYIIEDVLEGASRSGLGIPMDKQLAEVESVREISVTDVTYNFVSGFARVFLRIDSEAGLMAIRSSVEGLNAEIAQLIMRGRRPLAFMELFPNYEKEVLA